MIVCHCHAISDREIRTAARQGAVTADLVSEQCGAGGSCGGCRTLVEEIVAEETHHLTSPSSSPQAHVHLAVVPSA